MLDLASETKADSQMRLYPAVNWISVSPALPKLIYCNPNLQYELNWTSNMMVLGGGPLGADQVMRVKLSWMGLAPLYKRPQRVPSSICSVRTQGKDGCLWSWEQFLTKTLSLAAWNHTSRLQNCRYTFLLVWATECVVLCYSCLSR